VNIGALNLRLHLCHQLTLNVVIGTHDGRKRVLCFERNERYGQLITCSAQQPQ
jgi:hypothetical protein